jgi:hypothetical protein
MAECGGAGPVPPEDRATAGLRHAESADWHRPVDTRTLRSVVTRCRSGGIWGATAGRASEAVGGAEPEETVVNVRCSHATPSGFRQEAGLPRPRPIGSAGDSIR